MRGCSAFSVAFCFLLASFFTIGCPKIIPTPKKPVQSISLDRCPSMLALGTQEQLRAIIEPHDANQAVTWTSSNPSVATVTENGLVNALSLGEATIKVSSQAEGEKTNSCKITVVIPVSSVSIDGCVMQALQPGQTRALAAKVEPEGASQAVTWTSNNDNVATVDGSGVVTAGTTGGTAIIGVTTAEGGQQNVCAVTVTVPVTGVSISECSTASLPTGSTRTLAAAIEPANATNMGVSWTSNNTSVATVNVTTGVVTAGNTEGTARVTATTHDGNITATCDVTVAIPVTGVSISGCSITPLASGSMRTLTALIAPANATNRGVTWTSSNLSVATVNASTGVVTAGNTAGTARMTATTHDGNITAACDVTVVIPVTGVSISGCSTASLTPGQTRTLSATVVPANATNKGVSWTTNDTSVATVNVTTGVVTASNTGGTARITATTHDGSKTAFCDVPVTIPVTSVFLNGCPSFLLTAGERRTFTATVEPANATNKGVSWTSNNTSVATVSNGTVALHLGGTATITVRTDDGGKTSSCAIGAVPRVGGVIPHTTCQPGPYKIVGGGFHSNNISRVLLYTTTGDVYSLGFRVDNPTEITITSLPSVRVKGVIQVISTQGSASDTPEFLNMC